MCKVFKAGKYKGKFAEWVKIKDFNYYRWAILNAPNLIVDNSLPKSKIIKGSTIKPNLNFDNEGPWEWPI